MLSPAKLNLFLAVTGRRADGYHDLVSVVAQVDWGDDLTVEPIGPGEKTTLVCDDPAVPGGEDNLVLRAAAAGGGGHGRRFCLAKRIPMGAGLGGGSSNAAAALKLLGAADPALAATLGSDCPLFLGSGPVVMRGRGERISPLPAAAAQRVAGRRVAIFKPSFGISTPWAYRQMAAAAPRSYLEPQAAEARLSEWLDDPFLPLERLQYNNMERAAFLKFPALPALLDRLRRLGIAAGMTGSGSACFALLPGPDPALESRVGALAKEAWGPGTFCIFSALRA